MSSRGITHNTAMYSILTNKIMTKEQLKPGTDYYHTPSISEPSDKLIKYTFVDFNKVGNCIWKEIDALKEAQFTLTLYYTLKRFKTI